MVKCLDCGTETKAQLICPACKQEREAQWKKEVNRFRKAVESVWKNITK